MAQADTHNTTGEYRALEMFTATPSGCALFPVMDDNSDPHLRRGEIAVVDLSDRDPQHGEVYVVQWASGRRVITQILNRSAWREVTGEPEHWWTSPLTAREWIPGSGEARVIDGPYFKEGLRHKLVGRVIGLVNSLPLEIPA